MVPTVPTTLPTASSHKSRTLDTCTRSALIRYDDDAPPASYALVFSYQSNSTSGYTGDGADVERSQERTRVLQLDEDEDVDSTWSASSTCECNVRVSVTTPHSTHSHVNVIIIDDVRNLSVSMELALLSTAL